MKKLDEDIKKAFEEIAEQRELELFTDGEQTEDHLFPEDYFQNILSKIEEDKLNDKMSTGFGQRKKLLGKAFSKIAIITISISLICGITVYAMFSTGLIFQIFDANTNISSDIEPSEAENQSIDDIYICSYVPVGYTIESQTSDSQLIVKTIYTSREGGTITLVQQLHISRYNFDNQDIAPDSIIISGNEGYYLAKNNQSTIFWADNKYFFEIMAYPILDKEEMIKIAESLEVEAY